MIAETVALLAVGGEVGPPPPIVAFTAPFTNGTRPTGTTSWLSCIEKKPGAKRQIVVFSWTGNRAALSITSRQTS